MSSSKKIALGGTLSVLCLFSLYLAAVLPTNRLFFYGLSSVFCSIIMVEAGTKWSFIFYGATSMLAFLLVPNKLGIIPYLLFFGVYGIAKYYIEGIKNIVAELLLKGVFFTASMAGTAVIVQELFMGDVSSKIPLWGLGIIALIIFYIYDYAYTRFVVYYEISLRKKI